MAATVVTLTIPEASLPAVVKAVCRRAGVEVSNANAKPALVALITRWVEQEQREEAPVKAPEIE